jgi:hypothetical protein
VRLTFYNRGRITEVIAGPRWRVNHHGPRAAAAGLFDIVGGANEEEAKESVRRAYPHVRVIVSVARLE